MFCKKNPNTNKTPFIGKVSLKYIGNIMGHTPT